MSNSDQRLKTLLGDGCYFPRELPPQFTTAMFAEQSAEIAASGEWGEFVNLDPKPTNKQWPRFQAEMYSIPRPGAARRALSIVNPVPQMRAANLIASRWSDIYDRIGKTECSAHTPDIDGEPPLRHFNFREFGHRRLDISARHNKIVSADILRFYGALYTHAIAWALHGKREFQNLRHPERRRRLGDILDQSIRFGQDNQSVGIPVGPYTSRVISEIVGVGIDKELGRGKRQAVRHIDDWRAGVGVSETPQKVIADIAAACRKFGLDLNHEKTMVLPDAEFAWPVWLSELPRVRRGKKVRADAIQSFFAKAFDLAKKHPDSGVLSRAVEIADEWSVCPGDWKLFEGCLLFAVRNDAKIFPRVAKILAKHLDCADHDQIEALVCDVIRDHAPLGHHFEVSWALSLAKEFKGAKGFQIPGEAAEQICKMESSVCALLLLDLRDKGLVRGKMNTEAWQNRMTDGQLRSNMWLMVYEAGRREWLPPFEEGQEEYDSPDDIGRAADKIPAESDESFIGRDGLFRVLWERDISFYDDGKTIAQLSRDNEQSGKIPEDVLY